MTANIRKPIRAKFVFREVVERGYNHSLASVTKEGGVEYRSDLDISVWNPDEDTSQYKRVLPGDFVIGLRSFQSGIGYSNLIGLVSPAYTVLRPVQPIVPDYFRHLFKSSVFISRLENVAQGIRQGRTIGTEDFYNLILELPSLAEQQAIANYLDAETARIDILIDKKQRMIDLVNERERAIVARPFPTDIVYSIDGRAIGLNGAQCVRLGGVSKVQTGLTVDEGREGGLDAVTLPYLRVANVQEGSLNLSEVKEVTVDPALAARCTLRAGDVLMTEGGDPDKLGRGTVWLGEIEPCLHQNHIFAVRPNPNLLPEYLALVTRTPYARAYFEMTASKTTNLASTSVSKIAAFRIPLPDIAKQAEIVRVVHSELAKIDILRSQLTKQIDLLHEHRQALITAVVTEGLNKQVSEAVA